MAEFLIDHGKLFQGHKHHLKILPAGHAQGHFLEKAVSVSHGGQAVPLILAALKADKHNHVSDRCKHAVEQKIGICMLKQD